MNIQTLGRLLTMCEWNTSVLTLAMNDPLNRHGTRVRYSCDDGYLFENPEFLIKNFIITGGLSQFWIEHPEQKNIECPHSECPLKEKCILRGMNFYWKKCQIPRHLNCTKQCPKPEEIAASKTKRRESRPPTKEKMLCNTAYNLAQTIIVLTCPTNRNSTTLRYGLKVGEEGDVELSRHPDRLFEQFCNFKGKEEFAKKREDFFLPLCDTYSECGIRQHCPFTHHVLFWEHCPIRQTECKGNCTTD